MVMLVPLLLVLCSESMMRDLSKFREKLDQFLKIRNFVGRRLEEESHTMDNKLQSTGNT